MRQIQVLENNEFIVTGYSVWQVKRLFPYLVTLAGFTGEHESEIGFKVEKKKEKRIDEQ